MEMEERLERFHLRLVRVESEVTRLADVTRLAQVPRPLQDPVSPARPPDSPAGSAFVTRHEMADALQDMQTRIEDGVKEQFGRQMLAIGSLRAMIIDTDALLERVLARLEASVSDPGDPDLGDEDPREPDDDELIMNLTDPATQDPVKRDQGRKDPVRTLPG
jgi:hypothetical protein